MGAILGLVSFRMPEHGCNNDGDDLAERQKGSRKMKFTIDGDQVCFTKDDFVNLQESPAVFYPIDSETAKAVLRGGILSLSLRDLVEINTQLNNQV